MLRDLFLNTDRPAREAVAPDPRATAFHRSLPGYAPSRLVDAPGTAAALGMERLLVKLEVKRFGLPSFKVLGASWATCRALSTLAGRAEPCATLDELRGVASGLDVGLVAATDGNHGRAVARMARLLDLPAQILVPHDMAAARIAALRSEGAVVHVVDGHYDDAVAAAAALADARWQVISDTSWDGYTDVPGWVADGYTTIFSELEEQLPVAPDLVAAQIGVGALASALVRALARPGRTILGVEPADAACALAAVRDGEHATALGPHTSLMVGLNCGVASPVALPDMRAGIDAFAAVGDAAMERAVRLLHADGIDAGETGSSGVAGYVAVAQPGFEAIGAPAQRPVGLAIVTEAPTNPESFARIIEG